VQRNILEFKQFLYDYDSLKVIVIPQSLKYLWCFVVSFRE